MREIKFRAWDKELERMWNWTESKRLSRTFANGKETLISPLETFIQQSDRYNLMQFTGLFDRNSKEIWEGDIVQMDILTNEVLFKQGMFCIEEDGSWYPLSQFYSVIKVIGNIYENPELLKETP
jgi:uncharacterized phage protein (TIGR01671 family)